MRPRLNKMHIPERTCVVTRQKLPQDKLIRIGVDKNGDVKVNSKEGRGVYLLPEMEVFERGVKENKIAWGLKLNRKLKVEEIEKLREEFKLRIKN